MDGTPEQSPADDALDRLGGLIGAGASPDRITEEVGTIIAGWAAEAEMDAGIAQARIERLWDSIGKDAADLQEQVADADGEGAEALAQARRVLTAMNAAVTALAAAHERL